MPAGQPTKYKPAMCAVAIHCGSQGMGKAEIASELNVCRATLYNWSIEHPEFLDALKRAEDEASAWFAKTFREMAKGGIDKAVPTALIFQAKNQLPDDYRDRREIDVDAKVGVFEIDYTGYDEDEDDAED